jgi:hypothetical protein
MQPPYPSKIISLQLGKIINRTIYLFIKKEGELAFFLYVLASDIIEVVVGEKLRLFGYNPQKCLLKQTGQDREGII